MGFNLCPDNGPPRIWRFVEPGSLGYQGGRPIVSLLQKRTNIQLLDKELLDELGDNHRLMVLHTGAAYVTI